MQLQFTDFQMTVGSYSWHEIQYSLKRCKLRRRSYLISVCLQFKMSFRIKGKEAIFVSTKPVVYNIWLHVGVQHGVFKNAYFCLLVRACAVGCFNCHTSLDWSKAGCENF